MCLITDAYGGYGGIAVYNRDVLEALCKHPDMSEVVAVPRKIVSSLEPFPEKLIYEIGAVGSSRAFIKTLVRNLASREGFDVIYCAHINLVPLAWMMGKMLRARVILAIYGIDAWQATSRPLTNYLTKRVDAVISISNFTRDRFLEWSEVKPELVKLLPNAIRLENYGVGPKSSTLIERYNLSGKVVLLTLGRIYSKERAKGFDEVLDILPELQAEIPNLAYVIAGDGDYRQTLEDKAQQLGVRESVIFTGFIAEQEKPDLYRSSDVYVMPSRGEGFGFVFLEAMACGIPSIASSTDGSRDAVRDGKLGQIVDPADRAALKAAIIRALSKPRAVPDGIDYFDFPKFCARLHDIVDATIENE